MDSILVKATQYICVRFVVSQEDVRRSVGNILGIGEKNSIIISSFLHPTSVPSSFEAVHLIFKGKKSGQISL